MVKKESNGLIDLITSEKYIRLRNLSLVTIPMTLGFKFKTSQAVEPTKTKWISNEKELREQLENLQMEGGIKPLR